MNINTSSSLSSNKLSRSQTKSKSGLLIPDIQAKGFLGKSIVNLSRSESPFQKKLAETAINIIKPFTSPFVKKRMEKEYKEEKKLLNEFLTSHFTHDKLKSIDIDPRVFNSIITKMYLYDRNLLPKLLYFFDKFIKELRDYKNNTNMILNPKYLPSIFTFTNIYDFNNEPIINSKYPRRKSSLFSSLRSLGSKKSSTDSITDSITEPTILRTMGRKKSDKTTPLYRESKIIQEEEPDEFELYKLYTKTQDGGSINSNEINDINYSDLDPLDNLFDESASLDYLFPMNGGAFFEEDETDSDINSESKYSSLYSDPNVLESINEEDETEEDESDTKDEDDTEENEDITEEEEESDTEDDDGNMSYFILPLVEEI